MTFLLIVFAVSKFVYMGLSFTTKAEINSNINDSVAPERLVKPGSQGDILATLMDS